MEEEITTKKKTIASLGDICEKEIDEQRRKIHSFISSPFQKSNDSLLQRTQATAQTQVELANLKADLRVAEDDLAKALAVKKSKEANQMKLRDSISSTKSQVQVLRKTLLLHKAKREECAKVISQQLQVSKDNASKVTDDKADIHDAISWYNQNLGFHVQPGHGVKFTFTNIDEKRPTREFSFRVHYGHDIYTLLECEPKLDGIEQMVQGLNQNNDLFGFVRIMRDKFLKATLSELPTLTDNPPHTDNPQQQETSIVSASAPAMSFSADNNMSTPENKGPKVNPLISPVPTSSVRRSSRLKGKK